MQQNLSKTLATAITIILLVTSSTASAQTDTSKEISHVILIVLDGVRPDSLEQANTPNIDQLIASGSYTDNAYANGAITMQALPSIYTGATPEVHQVENWHGDICAESLIQVLEEAGFQCAVMGQDPIIAGYAASYTTGYDHNMEPVFIEYYTNHSIEYFNQCNPFFLTLYNPTTDLIGHEYGHTDPKYIQAIEESDTQIGRLMETMKKNGVYDTTLWVITTDHAREGTDHMGRAVDQKIWSIWSGPGIKQDYKMQIAYHIVKNYQHENLEATHRAIDVAPTITKLLGLRKPRHCQGVPIWQIMENPKATPTTISLETNASIYDPSQSISITGNLSPIPLQQRILLSYTNSEKATTYIQTTYFNSYGVYTASKTLPIGTWIIQVFYEGSYESIPCSTRSDPIMIIYMGTIIIEVIDQDRKPVPNTELTIKKQETTINTTRTDSTGMISISNIPLGSYSLEAKKPSYKNETLTFVVRLRLLNYVTVTLEEQPKIIKENDQTSTQQESNNTIPTASPEIIIIAMFVTIFIYLKKSKTLFHHYG